MGCCLYRSQVVDDPDIFHTEAKLIAASGAAHDVLLYMKNEKLYQSSPCCGLLCCSTSERLSGIRDVEVVTGTVKIVNHLALGTQVEQVHHINIGLKITVPCWRNDGTRVYDTPDAVELAKKMDPHFLGGDSVIPTRIDMIIRQPVLVTPSGGGGGGGGACGVGGGCH